MIKSNRGQLSIFMGITLILVMGMLAFIINVGLFVKAKINLQNAVDAAAFSGAATQARQLTNIAYANWEMRNTYKEWMFKYYILGQMALTKGSYNLNASNLSGVGNANFLVQGTPVGGNAATGGNGFDRYNVPSICVHNNTSTDICPIYNLPGIPRFPAIGVAGISEIHESFVNKLVEEKGENCSARTQINFLAALSWAYSSGTKDIPGAPLIATNKAGAWPESIELAMRIRNLEMVVNRPPVNDMNYNNLSALSSGAGQDIALNERPVKAFMSAFRNLGGGRYKDTLGKAGADESFDELAATFTMSELAPQAYPASQNSVSGFLIPSSFDYQVAGGGKALQKYYLDLQAVPLNLATMFTTFATTRNEFEPNVAAEASCFVSKSAMPVPGYILGFVKNPEVLTYYAVKGEARFTGLFFPNTQGSFKLTAYAAAKPFGGRIGPRLFGYTNSDASVVPRADNNARSSSYVTGIRVIGSMSFQPGMPIPPSGDFWVDETKSLVGGVPVANSGDIISYAIPNMIYDFESDNDLAAQNSGGIGRIQTVKELPIAGSSTVENRGLYNKYQIRTLKAALGPAYAGQNMTSQEVTKALIVARQVTKYDAANYLIPDFNRTGNSTRTNAAPTIRPDPNAQPPLPIGFQYKLYAPLLGDSLLYKNPNDVGTVVLTYMKANEKAIEAYLAALLQVGQKIYSLPSGQGSATNVNAQAAQSIHANAGTSASPSPIPAPLVSGDPMDASAPTCKKDMASKFYHFFTQTYTACGIVPLEKMMIEYIDKKNTAGSKYYSTSHYNPLPARKIMSAYYPSTRQGVDPDEDAMVQNPIGGQGTSSYSARRNFYSTKFIPLNKVLTGSNDYDKDVYRESDTAAPSDMQSLTLKNLIQADSTTGLGSSYFKDF